MKIYSGLIRKGFEREDLWAFIGFDDEANGTNGDGCLREEAKAGGFNSNAAFWIHQALVNHSETVDIVSSFCEALVPTWNSCSRYADYNTLTLENGDVVVAFAEAG